MITIRFKGERMSLSSAAKLSGVSYSTLHQRMERGVRAPKLFSKKNLLDGRRLATTKITIGKKTYTLVGLARLAGVSSEVMQKRLREGRPLRVKLKS